MASGSRPVSASLCGVTKAYARRPSASWPNVNRASSRSATVRWKRASASVQAQSVLNSAARRVPARRSASENAASRPSATTPGAAPSDGEQEGVPGSEPGEERAGGGAAAGRDRLGAAAASLGPVAQVEVENGRRGRERKRRAADERLVGADERGSGRSRERIGDAGDGRFEQRERVRPAERCLPERRFGRVDAAVERTRGLARAALGDVRERDDERGAALGVADRRARGHDNAPRPVGPLQQHLDVLERPAVPHERPNRGLARQAQSGQPSGLVTCPRRPGRRADVGVLEHDHSVRAQHDDADRALLDDGEERRKRDAAEVRPAIGVEQE